jgi:hypothetical protein
MKHNLIVTFIFMGLLTLSSCYSTKMISDQEDFQKYSQKKNVGVFLIQTSRDSMVYFSRKMPGKLTAQGVSGLQHTPLSAFKADAVIYKYTGHRVDSVVKNGITCPVIRQGLQELVCSPTDSSYIPLVGVKQLQIRYLNPVNTGIAAFVGTSVLATLIYMIANMSFNMGMDIM